jgi:hypothetical protein
MARLTLSSCILLPPSQNADKASSSSSSIAANNHTAFFSWLLRKTRRDLEAQQLITQLANIICFLQKEDDSNN